MASIFSTRAVKLLPAFSLPAYVSVQDESLVCNAARCKWTGQTSARSSSSNWTRAEPDTFTKLPVKGPLNSNIHCQSPRRQARVCASASDTTGVSDNQIGVHWLTWSGGLSEEDCKRAIQGSAKLGYDLVEVALGDPGAVEIALTKRLLQEANMGATASLGLLPTADISSDNSEIAAAGEKLLSEAVRVAAGIGATLVSGITYSALHKYPSGPTVAGRRNSVASLQRIAKQAADSNIQIGLEVVNRYESNLLNTASQAMELLSEIDHPGVLVHLDSYHMNIEENSAREAVEVCKDKLGYVHIGESHRGYLGTGSIDFPALFSALAAVNYKGPITFESFSSRVVNPQLSNTLCIWRNLWDDSEDLARHAKAFIDERWAIARK